MPIPLTAPNQIPGFGLTGGIGASQENISALVGLSAIVNKNFIITAGTSIQQFDVLKGQYAVGDNVGAEPIDSAVLAGKTYKFTGAIVLSYRFGSGN